MELPKKEERISSGRNSHQNQKLFFKLIVTYLITVFTNNIIQNVQAQCPWTRESIELHSDCICDFNPSLSSISTLDAERPVNRMSVQCSPVNFQQLLGALKQTASIELPNRLLRSLINDNNSSTGTQYLLGGDDDAIFEAGKQLASQAKLDLLHVSNSTIKHLLDNTFIIESSKISLKLNGEDLLASTNESTTTTATTTTTKNNQLLQLNNEQQLHLVVAIQSLHLSRCGIELIDPGAFNGLEWSLTSLSLSDNQLEFIPIEALSRLINLRVLDLSNNKFLQILENSFTTLKRLNTLRLADNRFGGGHQTTTTTTTTSTNNNGSILTTTLQKKSHQPVVNIDQKAFSGLELSLTDLNLKNTQLNAFPSAIKSLPKLAFLNLAQNQISQIPAKSFENMSSLTAINFERNRISQIEDDTFLGVESSLSSLSLLGNLLEIFPVNQLAKLKSIRRLDMGFNQLESLPLNAFTSNKQLILIALDGNPLETLPEIAFKPLEGTLRGMSIGGKALNCDCRLSWILRWQQEFNMQISSRERQPQFCSKPHYLRSLVSFAALKPEHLTCTNSAETTAATTTIQAATFPNYNNHYYHTTSIDTTTTTQQQQQQQQQHHQYVVKNFTSTAWTLSANNIEHETTMNNNNKHPAVASSVQTTPMPTTNGFTTLPSSSSSSSSSPSQTLPTIITTSYPISSNTEISLNDLTEASTNDELTERSDSDESIIPTTTEPTSSSASSPVAAATSLVNYSPTQSTKSQQNQQPITTTIKSTILFGERFNNNNNESGLTTTGNGIGILPEDEMFLENNTRKLNRHGYLSTTAAANQQKQRYNSQNSLNHLQLSQQFFEDLTRSPAQVSSDQSSSPSGYNQQQTTFFKPIVGPDLRGRATNNHHHNINKTFTFDDELDNSQKSQTQPMTITTTRGKQIFSVFGNRAGDNNNKTRGSSDGGRRNNNNIPSNSQRLNNNNNPSIIPAVPTTINVYKTLKNNHTTSNNNQQQGVAATTTGLFQKGARFVDEMTITSPAAIQLIQQRQSTRQPTTTTLTSGQVVSQLTNPPPKFSSTLNHNHQLIESDIERHSTASNIRSRISPPSSTTESTSNKLLPTTLKQIFFDITRFSEPAPATTTTSTIILPEQSRAPLSPNNNTRMSVSSMYKLATKTSTTSTTTSTTTTTTTPMPTVISSSSSTTTPEPTSVITSSYDLLAEAERETQKIMRHNSALQTSTAANNIRSTQDARRMPDVLPETATTAMVNQRSFSAKPTMSFTNHHQNKTRPSIEQESNNTETTTRMSATVRFVDSISSSPVVKVFKSSSPQNPQPTTTTTTTTTTPKPDSVEPGKTSTSSSTITSSSSTKPQYATSTAAGSKIVAQNQKQLIEIIGATHVVAPSINFSTSEIVIPPKNNINREKIYLIKKEQFDSIPITTIANQHFTTTTGNKPENEVLEAGEQQHEARITLKPPQINNKRLVNVGPANIPANVNANSGQQINQLITKDSLDQQQQQQHRQARDESLFSNQKASHQPGGGGVVNVQSSTTATTTSSSPSRLFGKLIKLTDFDQLALILASLLCLFILILAIFIICVCYANWLRKSRQQQVVTSSLSSFSSPSSSTIINNQQQQQQQSNRRPSLFVRIFCCCFIKSPKQQQISSSSSSSKRITPMQALILQDDDNSSSSSGSNGLKSTGKSMLLSSSSNSHHHQHQDHILFESIRRASALTAAQSSKQSIKQNSTTNTCIGNNKKRTKSQMKRRRSFNFDNLALVGDNNLTTIARKPLDHEASMKQHRQALAMDREYFVGVSGAASATRTLGRRKSMLLPITGNTSNKQQHNFFVGFNEKDWISDNENQGGTISSSCDSDKSFSPGSNRNNRYNINEAHRAYLKTKNANQIKASMFVTTTTTSQQQQHVDGTTIRKSGLLKTIENSTNQQQPAIVDLNYFDRCSRMSSDKSTTDDSRAPLNNNNNTTSRSTRINNHRPTETLRGNTTATTTTRSFGMPNGRSRSIGRLPEMITDTSGSVCDDYQNSELVPMSAEEQWPEPYNEPLEYDNSNQLMSFSGQQQAAGTKLDSNNNRQQQLSQRTMQQPAAEMSTLNSTNTGRRTQTHNRRAYRVAYDDAYLANWHTVGQSKSNINSNSNNNLRVISQQQQQQQQVQANNSDFHYLPSDQHQHQNNQLLMETSNELHHHHQGANLVRYRSIPGLMNVNGGGGTINNNQQTFLANQISGATNWLRWTPTNFVTTTGNNTNLDNDETTTRTLDQSSVGVQQQQQQQNGLAGMNSWHRDNQVDAIYVSSSNQQR